MAKPPILITVCSKGKKVPASKRLHARELSTATLADVASEWKTWLKDHEHTLPAKELYCGRGFSEALTTQSAVGADLWIISAGLGLIHSEEIVPAYDLTLISGVNDVRTLVTDGTFSPSDWWSEIGRRSRPKRSIKNLVANNPRRQVIISTSGSYLPMLLTDLTELAPTELNRCRLIGPPASLIDGDVLSTIYMPYDNRLDGPNSPIPGTKADFSQRAARHFIENIWLEASTGDIVSHREAVEKYLTPLGTPTVPKRQQLSDEIILKKISQLWDRADGKSQKMLRVLRDEELVACEQSRFSGLFNQIKKQKLNGTKTNGTLKLRAVRSIQGNNTEVFSFFIQGSRITEIADISRIQREEQGGLTGFQRREISQHVNSIVEYLDQGAVVFPNSITLALSHEVVFVQSRGKDPADTIDYCQSGTLTIPLREEGQRAAWIVDGQQRSLALAKTTNFELNVPVVAFIATDLEMQREQFILVNKAKPLPTRLINELLPEVDVHLPRDLASRKVPSALCDLLNRDPQSPFYGLIKRISQSDNENSVISDNAIIEMIKASLKNPIGALAPFKEFGSGPPDTESIYATLIEFWTAVRKTFPEAWGKPPSKSRLMHSAGIKAMGVLMDRIVNRASTQSNRQKYILSALKSIKPDCRWTSGTWESMGLEWNEIQQTNRHVRQLTDVLMHLDYEASSRRS